MCLPFFVNAGANFCDDQAALMILCTLFQKKNQDSLIYIYEEHEVYIDRTIIICICISFLCPIDD